MVSIRFEFNILFDAITPLTAESKIMGNLDMKTIVGTSNRIIEVNLTTGQTTESQVDKNDRRRLSGWQGAWAQIAV
jgi:hypothetical protein